MQKNGFKANILDGVFSVLSGSLKQLRETPQQELTHERVVRHLANRLEYVYNGCSGDYFDLHGFIEASGVSSRLSQEAEQGEENAGAEQVEEVLEELA